MRSMEEEAANLALISIPQKDLHPKLQFSW